jgi:hypothetical protein
MSHDHWHGGDRHDARDARDAAIELRLPTWGENLRELAEIHHSLGEIQSPRSIAMMRATGKALIRCPKGFYIWA